jgi:hypothetical protein
VKEIYCALTISSDQFLCITFKQKLQKDDDDNDDDMTTTAAATTAVTRLT